MPRSDKVIAPFKQVIWGNLSLNVDWKKKSAILRLFFNFIIDHRSFMNQKGIHVSTWACDTLPHPHQKDSSSCGAFDLKVRIMELAKSTD